MQPWLRLLEGRACAEAPVSSALAASWPVPWRCGGGGSGWLLLFLFVRACVSSLLFTICFWSFLLNSRGSGVLPHKH